MAVVVGNPGESAVAKAGAQALVTLGTVTLFMVVPAVWAIGYYSSRWGFVGLVASLAALWIAYRWRRRDLTEIIGAVREGRSWLKGAEGEYRVHQELIGLPDHFIVFHDYHPRGSDGKPVKWNVDHIVVGPSGVFVLDAKNYSSARVLPAQASRRTRENVAQADRNARELKKRLVRWSDHNLDNVFVVPVVVYVGDDVRIDRLREGFVRVLPLRLLNASILDHTEDSIDLERAARVARALFSQLPPDRQVPFRATIDAYIQAVQAAPALAARTGDQRTGVREPMGGGAPEHCPLCGGVLIRRTARTGKRAGKDFLGCENYRKNGCTFGFNLDQG